MYITDLSQTSCYAPRANTCESEAVLLLNMHHIAADGRSMGVLRTNAGLSQWVETVCSEHLGLKIYRA